MKKNIAIDIGGTKILGVSFDEKNNMIDRAKKPTKTHKGIDEVISRLFKVIDSVEENKDNINAIGVGVPGIIKKGVIIFTPNLPLSGFNLKKALEEKYNVPVYVGNDANTSLLGEWKFGGLDKYKNVIGYFAGTGVGGGLILNGKLYTGSKGGAGEIGHTIVDPAGPFCGCGNQGCLEAFSSKTGIFQYIMAQKRKGRKSILISDVDPEKNVFKSSILENALNENDELAEEIIDKVCYYLGVSSANMINLLNPDKIVFGGGLIESLGEKMLPLIKHYAKMYSILRLYDDDIFKLTSLGDDACIYGALTLIENPEVQD